jgi:hypothetical protein
LEADPSSFDAEAALCEWQDEGETAGCDPPFRGGVRIWTKPAGWECTAGFPATGNQFGNKFVMTAGHCLIPPEAQWAETSNGYPNELGAPEGAYFAQGQADAGLIRVKNSNWWVKNWEWRGHIVVWGAYPGPGNIAYSSWPIVGSQSSFVGEFICHSGIAAGSSCGNVSQLNVKVTYKGGESLTHMTKVDAICGIEGDSGGPVWGQGNWAVGIWSGGIEGCTSHYYSEVRELEQVYGVHVTPW